MNSGKNAKSPNALIKEMYDTKKPKKQSLEDGLSEIQKIKELERKQNLNNQKR